ncbi:unnamed protein product [Ambrosiozyma monospora]|uniref:Unnamed protein product n=1 Tax=Ambrosiozyma monospora TaxID=43982 RepID=A0A9W6Z772_AMBMO|nr:unnamed protein product [Ambrosiozyma monospora]
MVTGMSIQTSNIKHQTEPVTTTTTTYGNNNSTNLEHGRYELRILKTANCVNRKESKKCQSPNLVFLWLSFFFLCMPFHEFHEFHEIDHEDRPINRIFPASRIA